MNVHTLGVKGDGVTDDTDAIRKAIASSPILYFPTGYYIVSDTITLEPDTIVIALHPGTTQFDLPDATPGYAGVGPPKALLETPRGGTNIVSGLGLYTGGINPRAVAALWMSGESSLMYDVRFHGPFVPLPQQVREAHYRVAQPAAPGAAGRWGAQYPSLWVTRRRRRHVRIGVESQHLRALRLLRVGHTDAGLCVPTVVRAPSRARDQAGTRGQLGVPRAADRRGSPRRAPTRSRSRSSTPPTSRSPTSRRIA